MFEKMIVKDHPAFRLLGLTLAIQLLASGCGPTPDEGDESATPDGSAPSIAAPTPEGGESPTPNPANAPEPAVSGELAEVLAEMEQIQGRGIELSKELTRIETEARTDAEITQMIDDLETLRETQDQTVLDWLKVDHPDSSEQVERFVTVGKQLEEMQFETPEEGADTPSVEEQQATRMGLITEYQELELSLNPILQAVREQERFLELQGIFTNRVQQVQDALFSKMEAIDPQVAEWREERDQLAERFTSLREQANTIQLRSMAPATNAAPEAPTIAPTIEEIGAGEPEE